MRVTVIGARGKQKSNLIAFGRTIGIKVTVVETPPAAGVAVSRCLVMASFCTHSSQYAIERRSRDVRVVHGGLSAVRAALREFAKEGQIAACRIRG